MTQEEKQELIIALCGYLPYKCKGKYEIVRILESETKIERFDDELDSNVLDYDFEYENFKPYLRLMSSMTEEEKEELRHEHIKDEKLFAECLTKAANGDSSMRGKVVLHFAADWCNKNHFDYRGLIPMGLALKAPEGMYNKISNNIMTNTKFKIGDMFTRKGTRDEIPLEITSIHQEYEPIYTLTPIRLCGDELVLGEDALIALYNKIN